MPGVNEGCLLPQLYVAAYDSAYPEMIATTRVLIKVKRNENGPEFKPSANYEKTIVEGYGVGESILQVSAVDEDDSVSIAYHFIPLLCLFI